MLKKNVINLVLNTLSNQAKLKVIRYNTLVIHTNNHYFTTNNKSSNISSI